MFVYDTYELNTEKKLSQHNFYEVQCCDIVSHFVSDLESGQEIRFKSNDYTVIMRPSMTKNDLYIKCNNDDSETCITKNVSYDSEQLSFLALTYIDE